MNTRTPFLAASYSPINQAWIIFFGDIPCGIGPDNRRIFGTLAELTDYLAATRTELTIINNGTGSRRLV